MSQQRCPQAFVLATRVLLTCAVLLPAGFRAEAGERVFCTGGPPDCTPDVLGIRFETGTDNLSELRICSGAEIEAAVTLDVVSEGIGGWTFGVAHDLTALELLSVSTEGSDVSELIGADQTEAAEGGLGFISVVILSSEEQLPVGNELRLVTVRYRAVRDIDPVTPTTLTFSEALRTPLGPPNRDPVPIALVLGGTFPAPETLFDGDITGAALRPLSLATMSPTAAGQGSRVSAVIEGQGLRQPDLGCDPLQFILEHADDAAETIPAGEVTIVSARRAEVVFDVQGSALGFYHLKAFQGDAPPPGCNASDTVGCIDMGFELISAALAQGFSTKLGALNPYGFGRIARVTLKYENVSDEEQTAPLFKIVGPPDTEMKLERDQGFGGNELFVLGVNPGGFAGKLPIRTQHQIPIVFRSRTCPQQPFCPVNFDVYLFTPRRGEFVAWDRLPAPGGVDDWQEIWPPLSGALGASWRDYRENLATLSTRLTRRGVDGCNVSRLTSFAVRQASGAPSAAVLGCVGAFEDGAPMADVTVVALSDGEPVACTTTDADGEFALEGLESGGAYQFEVLNHSEAFAVRGEISETDDLLGVELLVTGEDNDGVVCPLPRGESTPPFVVIPPEGTFTRIHRQETNLVAAVDPNDKTGTDGEEVEDSTLLGFTYTINFQNKGCIPAQRVEILDDLSEVFDPTSVRLQEVTFGRGARDELISLDRGQHNRSTGFSETGDLTSGYELVEIYPRWNSVERRRLLEIDAAVVETMGKHTIRWTFQTLDPDTMEPPDDLDSGFLVPRCHDDDPKLPLPDCPNDELIVGCPGVTQENSQGSVTFHVTQRKDADLSEVLNFASIKFDTQDVIDTNVVRHVHGERVPADPPRNFFPADGNLAEVDVQLIWEPSDRPATYDVYLWKQGGNRERVASDLEDNTFDPELEFDTPYNWDVVAKNSFGDPTDSIPQPSTFTTVVEPPPCPDPPTGLIVDLSTQPLTLSWTASQDAQVYTILLGTVADGQPTVLLAAGIEATEFQLTSPLPGGTYSWQVVALNRGCPDAGAESETVDFEIDTIFLRGDTNQDGGRNILDVIHIIGHLFRGGPGLECEKSADVNDDGDVLLSDAVELLTFLFLHGDAPPAPFPLCGVDPTEDNLTCETFGFFLCP